MGWAGPLDYQDNLYSKPLAVRELERKLCQRFGGFCHRKLRVVAWGGFIVAHFFVAEHQILKTSNLWTLTIAYW